MPATFFVLESGTDCNLAKAFWEQNSEVGVTGQRCSDGPEKRGKDRCWAMQRCQIAIQNGGALHMQLQNGTDVLSA